MLFYAVWLSVAGFLAVVVLALYGIKVLADAFIFDAEERTWRL